MYADTHHAHHWSICINWLEIVMAIGWIKIIYGVSLCMYADTHHTHHWLMCISWLEIVTFIGWIKIIEGLMAVVFLHRLLQWYKWYDFICTKSWSPRPNYIVQYESKDGQKPEQKQNHKQQKVQKYLRRRNNAQHGCRRTQRKQDVHYICELAVDQLHKMCH